jgi:hypothetical protein
MIALDERHSGPEAASGNSGNWLQVALSLLFLATLGLTCGVGIRHASEPFDYPHAFVSADVSTTARTFARIGIFRLHAVPANNNPPITRNDAYTHWPPLLPMILSLCFRAFGATEKTAHLLMLVIGLTTALLIFAVGTVWRGVTLGLLAGFFWLTLPVTLQFGHLVSQQALVTMFMVAGVLAFLLKRNTIAGVLLFLAAMSSWEVILLAAGLLLVSFWDPTLRATAKAAVIGAGAGTLCVVAIYMAGNRELAVDTLQAAKFYMGLSTTFSRVVPLDQINISTGEQIRRMFNNNVLMLGPLGIGAAIQMFAVRFQGRTLILSSFATPWLVWSLAMKNHMARHHFELAIAAPLIALALAWMATTPSKRPALKIAVIAILAMLQIALLPKPVIGDGYDPKALIRYADAIRESTEPDAIVMAPLISAVPIYYSDRHIIRRVDNSESAAAQLPEVHREFPGHPVYVAAPPVLATSFPEGRTVLSNDDCVIKLIAP